MQRRNFLQALVAAASGLTVAGRAAVAASSPPLAAPKPAGVTPRVATTTAKIERHLDESQRMVIEMLKECRVISVSQSVIVSGAETWTVTYRHAPNASRTSLDDEADEASRGRVPRSVNVSAIASSVGIDDPDEFGHYSLIPSFDRGDYEIEVEWI
jgi:hypothetical protein